ncbi:MAG: hypothetical protein V3U71_03480 [Cocleimonas sp.]
MSLSTKQNIELWVKTSDSLLQSLLPENSKRDMFGKDLAPGDFARLIDKQFIDVDQALIDMAKADDEQQAKMISATLSEDTAIALFTRWEQYILHWRSHPIPNHWIPEDMDQMWRAIFMSMTCDRKWSKEIAKPILGDWFEELR